MGRHKQDTPVEAEHKMVRDTLRRRLEIRQLLLAPCPLTPREIHRLVYTEEELEAMETIAYKGWKLLELESELWIQLNDEIPAEPLPPFHRMVQDKALRPKHLKVEFGEGVCLPRTSPFFGTHEDIPLSSLRGAQPELIEWGKEWMRLSAETQAVLRKVNSLFTGCTTFGHTYRAWPGLYGFFSGPAYDKIKNAKARSPWPSGLNPDFYTPSVLSPYEAIITEAMLLPDDDHSLGDFPVSIHYDIG